jgi:hypothetical protein
MTLEEEIEDSELIIQGHVIDTFTRREKIKNYNYNSRDKKIRESSNAHPIYTTFVFHVDEVLKGDYSRETIDVKMYGGCLSETECEIDRTQYNYTVGEQGVVFLKRIFRSEHFRSKSGSYTAFSIHDGQILTRKMLNGFEKVHSLSIQAEKEENDTALTLSSLKSLIRGMEYKP